jgi:nucleotide-binding universal stress UspA family protein
MLSGGRMSIICATDFSPLAEAAAREAAGWAVRLDQPLILAHVIPTAPAAKD